MKLAYTLDQMIALQSGGGYFDLHNNYELVSALHDGDRGYLHFVKRTAAWVKGADPSHLAVAFEQVSHFQVSEGMPLPTSVQEIGFKEPGDLDTDSWMLEPGVGPVHMLFRVEDDHFIRIGAETSFLLTSWPTT
ncbi:hypothetical protein Q5H92_10695 [Hymenobacter sp. M29]|uniref:Uncharacterized protein n=1 Tax=Hymenobacter mellowenesis TaxID=3063995 RepID=A0ABT9AAG1_9BACT|nr:hypothetical protein [Hymenobacter sp. M29]MDO7846826.1 hypothetical protein [Hymenobacter sp. M29]